MQKKKGKFEENGRNVTILPQVRIQRSISQRKDKFIRQNMAAETREKISNSKYIISSIKIC